VNSFTTNKTSITLAVWSKNLSRDGITKMVLGLIASVAVLLLVLILFFLLLQSWPVLNTTYLPLFFSSDSWHPLEGKFGLLHMLWATLAAGLGALVIALPLGLATAVFSLYMAPAPLARSLNLIVAILAGIPSVVYGLWGLTVIVPLINQWQAPGASLLAAMLILALMVLPTIAITTRSALSALPISLQQAAASLALSRATTIIQVLLPAAKTGIRQGVLLALARALGETMAVLMVAGNVVQTPHSLFDPVRVLTANIALEMAYATDHHRAALFASGLLLMVLVSITLWLAVERTKNTASARPHA